MADEDKVGRASTEPTSGRSSDAAATRPDTTPPASGRRSGAPPSVFDTDDAEVVDPSPGKPSDDSKPSNKEAMAPTQPAPINGDVSRRLEAGKAAQEDRKVAPGASQSADAKPKADAKKTKPSEASQDDKKSASRDSAGSAMTKAEPKRKSFGETTQKSITSAGELERKIAKQLDDSVARQRSTPAAEDAGRQQTIPPPAGSAAAAAASKVPAPPGVSARTVPPPERHVPTAAPPGIGRMEEKLNGLSVSLRNYVVASITLLVAFAIALVVEARTGWLHASASGETYGKIYVEKPEVVSRDRLVHDRAVQDEWLRALLGAPASLKPASRAGATLSAARPAAGESEAGPASSAEANEPAQAVIAEGVNETDPLLDFRDQLAFRNEVRAELIDNLLDDERGPAGNTLYLLKFDSTLVPQERTRAFGVVRADVGSIYGKALDEGSDAVIDATTFDLLAQKLLGRPEAEVEALGALHGLFSKALGTAAARVDAEQARGRRLIQDALRSNTSANDDAPWLGGVKPDVSPAEQWSDAALEELDLDDLYAFADYLGKASATSEVASGCPQGRDVQIALARVACVLDKQSSGKGRGKRVAREAKLAQLYAAYYVAGPGAPLAASLAPFAALTSSRAGVSVQARTLQSEGVSKPSGWLAKAVGYNLVSVSTRPAAPEAAPQSDDAVAGPVPGPSEPRTEQVLSKHAGFLEFLRRVLGEETRAFTHAVGQRTSASEAVGQRTGLDDVLRGAGARVDAAALRATLSEARRKSRLANAVERNPLVIGFSADLLDPTHTESANFGWLLGPTLELTAGDIDAKFTHKPVNNPLSVIVSVPSWWRSMRVNLAPFWLRRDGACVGVDGKERSCDLLGGVIQQAAANGNGKASSADGVVNFDVALPGDERGLQAILLPEGGLDAPTVFRDRLQAVTVRAGQPAAIVIPGKNLWKNSTVTLGAQIAEHVAVLPDTSGIIAKFEQVRWPGAAKASVQYRGLPLNVWTSRGRAYAGQVIVYPEAPAAPE